MSTVIQIRVKEQLDPTLSAWFDGFTVTYTEDGDTLLTGTVSEGLLAARAQFVDLAREHLGKAEAAIAALPRPLRPAFAPVALLGRYLAAAEAAEETPFAPPRDVADWRKIAAMSWWSWRQR